MDLTWDPYLEPIHHPRYSSVTKCKYYPILGKHNDGVIMDFIDKGIEKEQFESEHKIVLDGLVNNK